jgi:uncharacterized protein (DUF1330 family)
MKRSGQLAIAVGIGLGLGVIGGFSLAAPNRSAFVITEIDHVANWQAFEALKATSMSGVVGAQLADGRYLARTENILALAGAAPKAVAIISFDTEAKAKAYYENSKELTSARMKVGTTRSFIVIVCSERGVLSSDC